MKKNKQQIAEILDAIRSSVANPDLKTELNYETPFQLMMAVILSAQTTDKQVNRITPPLFARIQEPKDVLEVSLDEIESHVRYVNYYRNKAKFIKQSGEVLAKKFNGIIPDDLDLLRSLPGVGIKTAKVILSVLYDAPFVAVDTHVHRVANRIGLTKTNMPEQTDKALDKVFTTEQKKKAHHAMVLFGRYFCMARHPKCVVCTLKNHCRHYLSAKK